MATWHKLSLVLGLPLIALTGFAGCGGLSDEDGTATGGAAGASSGGETASGGSSAGGSVASGGRAQGGMGQGGGVTCGELSDEYAKQLDEAKRCIPELSVEQCTQKALTGLACACPDFLNPKNAAAIAELDKLRTDYKVMQCADGVQCGPCFEPTRAYCSPAGRCENVATTTTGLSCKVNGVVYPDGAEGIPDPTSCNKCSCIDGSLACTEIYCPVPCPAGTSQGTQCAKCGLTDGCVVQEYGCLPTCTEICEAPGKACIKGVCATLCG